MGLPVDRAAEIAQKLGMPSAIADLLMLPLPPQNTVTIEPFALDRTEVTNSAYEKFIREARTPDGAPYPPPPSPQWQGTRVKPGFERHPVSHVNFAQAQAYAKWAGKRLPTEAEWEWAARGPQAFLYPWGDEFVVRNANVFGSGRSTGPAPVSACETDVSPFGVMDMAGNVREWTDTRFAPYPGSKALSTLFRAGDRVVRGGSYRLDENGPRWVPMDCSAVMRLGVDALARPRDLEAIGFRCAKSVNPSLPQPAAERKGP